MVGRQAEQKRIARFLSAGKRGHAVCLISGDAGIGKTFLLEGARAAARRRGFAVLGTAPDESEADLPFSGLGDLLESVPGDLQLTELRLLADALRGGKALEPRTLPAAVARALRALSERRPLLISLDNLEWLDNSSWRALRFALRRVDGHRVAVAAALRSADSERGRAVVRSTATASVERLELTPLPDDAVEELLRRRGVLPDARADRRRLLESAAGNPYFALELAAGWQGAWGDRETLPAALSAVLSTQLAGAPPLVVRALAVVALESGARRELLEEVLGRDGTTAVDQALAHRLLVDAGPRGVRLSHPLLGAVALELTRLPSLRRLRHRLALAAPDPVARGMHLARASVRADAATAASIETAAQTAQRRGASSEAAQLYMHAARLTPLESGAERSRRLVASADLHTAAGETRDAIDVLESLAGSLDPGPPRASVLARLGALRYRTDRMDVAIDTFRAGLDDAGSDEAAKIDLLRRLSLATMMSGDLGGAARLAAEASAAAGSSTEAPETRAFEAMVHAVMGRPGAAKRVLGRQARGAPRGAPFGVPVELRAPTIRALASTILHGSARGASELDRLCRQADRDGDHASLPYLLANLCEAEIARGAWEEADAVGARAAPFLDEVPDALTAFLFAALARLAACRGRLADAERLGRQGLEVARRSGIVPAIHYNEAALGFLELTRGRYKAVDVHLGELVAGMAALGLGEPHFARFVPDQVEALVRLGRPDAARVMLAWWEERGRALGSPFAAATGARCRALLHAAEGDRAKATAALAAAAEHHAILDEPFEHGRTELVAAEVHRRARRRGQAHAALESALAIFQTLGAPVWARKADAECARIGTRRERGDDARLTDTELRIVDLVASGATNREVAQALFVATSTVEAALWRIYRKLDLRSRTELTRWHLDAAVAPPPRAGRDGASHQG